MFSFTTDDAAGYIEITVNGAISEDDFEGVVKAIDRLTAVHGRLNALEIVRGLPSLPSELWWKDLKYSLSNLDSFGRCAVVSEMGWIGPVTRFFAALLRMEIRAFPLAELEEARAWARGQ
ncbi:MAG: STAS/SEC14 domain-containing protein [Gemmatimonadota bacterium]|jgi:hypothetical protein|nr:STAS/SEC14 domain-containing protein [Gemmatimonadota bacterium]